MAPGVETYLSSINHHVSYKGGNSLLLLVAEGAV